MPQSTTRIYPLMIILLVSLAVLSVFHPYPYDNVVTRWALSRQLIDNASITIDPYIEYTNDRAFFKNHYYCDKAVLTSIIAAIPYAITKAVTGLTNLDIPQSAYRYIAERLSTGISFVLLLFFISKMLRRKEKSIFLPLLALGAGSILLPYSTLLYGHVPAAFFLFMSYYCQNSKNYLKADIFGALATAVEFPVILPFLILAAYRGRKYWNLSTLMKLVRIIILVFIPQFLHNWIAFGNPVTMGYSLETADAFEGMSRGLFGFTFPSLKAIYLLLLSSERGLIFYMPWTVLGIAGFFQGKRIIPVLKKNPLPLMTVTYVILFSAYYMPTGGWAFGPRHLIPIIPFFVIGLAKFISISRKHLFIAALLVLPSILIALIGTFGEIHQPVHPFENPVLLPQWNIGLTMMLDGHHSLWIFGTAGAVITISVLLFLMAIAMRRSKLTWKGFAVLLLWFLLSVPSLLQHWGGKTDYYRGVLAEHRQEWALAADYYESASTDRSAPDIVIERISYCRLMQVHDYSLELEF